MIDITIIRKKNNLIKRLKTKEKFTYKLKLNDDIVICNELYNNLDELFNRLTQDPINLDARPILLYEKE